MRLHPKERIDYIYRNRLRIIQSKDTFPFSKDSVLLGQFVSVAKTRGKMIDLCSGNGSIALVMAMRSNVQITGVEVQPGLCDMARRSATLNGYKEQLDFICGDITEASEWPAGMGTYDVVTCNPPYFQEKEKNKQSAVSMARHEATVSFVDVAQISARLVKYKGKAAFVYRPDRLAELFHACERVQLTPKRLQFVHPKAGKEANMVLVETIKGGNPGVKTLPPITVYDQEGNYTEQFLQAYEGKETEKEQRLATEPGEDVSDHYVYILECRDGSYYTGYAREPFVRLEKHNEGTGAKYTRGRGPVTLIHLQAFPSKETAMREEWRIKQLTKAEKKQLIAERRRRAFGSGHSLSHSDPDWKS
ncbi:GIY-YIG nuclease family protein [Salicibibacter kimchii]|uniref:Methyltransferase domain-containing protein n=1 Tax=Salicibibacter kimchii TaxID=2099786 RepID=A0A345C040_9BACI|nr:GIY-YIG nuclease family protein [Salicibibacter kimchii]AXF56571.1 methyltransferase domain-containing protein [Salicibibacter kimchii]